MDHKEQYQSYLAQAMTALEHACARFLSSLSMQGRSSWMSE